MALIIVSTVAAGLVNTGKEIDDTRPNATVGSSQGHQRGDESGEPWYALYTVGRPDDFGGGDHDAPQGACTGDECWEQGFRLSDVPRMVADIATNPHTRDDGRVHSASQVLSTQSALSACGDGCVRDLIARYDWPYDEALSIMWCESGGDPHATSPDGQNLGLFQVNVIHRAKVHGDITNLYNVHENVRVAYQIWRDQSWAPWSCKPHAIQRPRETEEGAA